MRRLKNINKKLVFMGCTLSILLSSSHAWAVECVANKARQGPNLDNLKTRNAGDIAISAERVSIDENTQSVFEGKVVLQRDNVILEAQDATVNNKNGKVTASGPIYFSNGLVDISAESLKGDTNESRVLISEAKYKFIEKFARGEATLLDIDREDGIILHGGTFTTCPEGDDSWHISASEIILPAKENWGEAWHATLSLYDVPVFYLPYVTFSLTDERKSGLLYPEFRNSKNSGLEISQPFYWNIAPNYDATITPRYISERGNQLLTEFRYLHEKNKGHVFAEYLDNDDKLTTNASRWMYSLKHQGKFSENWRYFIDYSDVSDDNYFVDLNSAMNIPSSETELHQFTEVGYFAQDWSLKFKYRAFEVLGDHEEPYTAVPYIDFRYQKNLYSNISFGLISEFASFINDDNKKAQANRLHVEPSIKWSVYDPAIKAEVEASMMMTYFDQEPGKNNLDNIDESVTRTLPKLRALAGLNFERSTTWGGNDMIQTFEPQIQYLFVGNRDQDNIGFYDTDLLQDDYYGLFRANRYSSYDRVANANQITLGATTRIIDEKNQERLRFSLGQIIYFEDSTANFNDLEAEIKQGQSALASELFMKLGDRWGFRNSIQYDSQNDRLLKLNTTIDWRLTDRKLVQFNYRYVPSIANEKIRQAGILVSQPIDKDWQLVASYHRDLDDKRSIEHYAGLQYQSCCWGFRVAWYRSQNTQLGDINASLDDRDPYDSGIIVKFMFGGVGAERKINLDGMVDYGIFGYRRPFYLNN